MTYRLTLDKSQVSRCLFCLDPPCTTQCPQQVPVGSIIRSLYFENYRGAAQRMTSVDCTSCDAPCERACVLSKSKEPVDIRSILTSFTKDIDVLPTHKIEDVDLSTDICGVQLQNPFLLSSSVVASTYEMCSRAFEMGWAGAAFKTICTFPQHETSPRFSAVKGHSNAFFGFKNIEQLSDHSVE